MKSAAEIIRDIVCDKINRQEWAVKHCKGMATRRDGFLSGDDCGIFCKKSIYLSIDFRTNYGQAIALPEAEHYLTVAPASGGAFEGMGRIHFNADHVRARIYTDEAIYHRKWNNPEDYVVHIFKYADPECIEKIRTTFLKEGYRVYAAHKEEHDRAARRWMEQTQSS